LCGAPGFYDKLGATTTALVDALRREAEAAGVQFVTDSIGGMAGAFFAGRPPAEFDDARAADHQRFARFFHAMLDRGVWLPPSGFEAWFVSAAHTEEDIDLVARAARSAFAGLV
jgi:glutamate-1-semialdehyde 2,1-aminomutase